MQDKKQWKRADKAYIQSYNNWYNYPKDIMHPCIETINNSLKLDLSLEWTTKPMDTIFTHLNPHQSLHHL